MGGPLFSQVFNTPGMSSRTMLEDMLEFGRHQRDEAVWKYPHLPGALSTFRQMSETREFRVAGTITGAPRAMEWLNNAIIRNFDGTMDYGFQGWRSRRINDYIIVGMTAFYWGEGEPLEYLDPVNLRYDPYKHKYFEMYTGREFPADQVVIHKVNPIGKSGVFISPIFPVIPSAMLSWLVREHDLASADGRKMRDIKIVANESLADSIRQSIESSLAAWNGQFDPTKHSVPVVYYEETAVTGTRLKADEMVASFGLAEIPDGFNRDWADFKYANEISANLGLSLRAWWNSERATNRALEEINEARQVNKGPGAEVRAEQRLLNDSGCLQQFGRRTRVGFIEEVDAANKEVNAKVIKLYSEALKQFAETFSGKVNGDAFLSWLKSENILPPDIDLITDVGVVETQDRLESPDGESSLEESEPKVSPALKSMSDDLLDYDEIVIDRDGKILTKRLRSFFFEDQMAKALQRDPAFVKKVRREKQDVSFVDALNRAREVNAEYFFKHILEVDLPEEEKEDLKSRKGNLNANDHRKIKRCLDRSGILIDWSKVS